MNGENLFVLVLLGLVILPFYVMVLSMFIHVGKMTAMKAMLKSNSSKKD